MNATEKRVAALKLLAATDISRGSYEPTIFRLLWRLGINVPPPHFASFWRNALFAGSFFAVGWGLLMWLLLWSRQGMAFSAATATAAGAGLFFGLAMASYYAYGKRKYRLPSWQELGVSS